MRFAQRQAASTEAGLTASGSVVEIGAEIGSSPSLYGGGPVLQFVTSHLPELSAGLQISQNGVALASCEEFFCERHIRAEGIELRRPRCLTRSEEILLCSRNVAALQGNTPENDVSLVKCVAVVPVILEFRGGL